MKHLLYCLIFSLASAIQPPQPQKKPEPPPLPPAPPTPKKPVTDMYHGTEVRDDYRWLEDRTDPALRAWLDAQNQHTREVLNPFSDLKALNKRVGDLLGEQSPDYTSLTYQGGILFALKRQPPKEQEFLITLPSPEKPTAAKVVVDPNEIDKNGKTTIDFYVPSYDARLVAVSLSEGGSEEGNVHVYEVETGKELPDIIPRVNYPTAGGSVAWNADGSGFWYTRYPRGNERPKEDMNFYQQVYFHKLGEPTEKDTYVIGRDEFPRIAEITLQTTPDGRYLLATVANGDGGEYAHFLRDPDGKWRRLTAFHEQYSAAVFGPDETLYLVARKGAPRGKLVRLSLKNANDRPRTIINESAATIEGFAWTASGMVPNIVVTPTRLYVVDQNGGPSQVRAFDHDGRQLLTIPILPVSSVGEVLRGKGDQLLLRNESYVEPPAWYVFDPESEQVKRTALVRKTRVDFSDVEVVRDLAVSKDGTKVPINILRRKGTPANDKNPTLLQGYGGFGISQVPSFKSGRKAWLEQGGVLAIANLRGGGEYGEEWHKAGMLLRKQNVFDDFAACARYLIEHKITSPEHLAIEGGSNGGLLMGAELTQHPDLFRAVVSHVGIYDMLRFEQNPNGVFNVTEYGSVKDPKQFQALYAYSPYHHVKNGTAYPAVFLICGENDGRVSPSDSWKMAARLQAAASSKRPVILWTKSGSGHGLGASLSERITEETAVDAFLFQQLGVKYVPVKTQ